MRTPAFQLSDSRMMASEDMYMDLAENMQTIGPSTDYISLSALWP